MISTKFLLPLLLVFAGIGVCFSQDGTKDSKSMDSKYQTPNLSQDFAADQTTLVVISSSTEQIKCGSVSAVQMINFSGMMTATMLREEVDLCYQAGMYDFIGKPFNTAELLHKMNQLIKK